MRLPVFLALGLWAHTASAAPIIATEPPDRPPVDGPSYVLDVGANLISGSVFGSPFVGDAGDCQDHFSVVVPGHLVVTATSFVATGFTILLGETQLGCFTGAGCFGTNFFSTLANPASGSTSTYTATAPYAFYQGGVSSGGFTYSLALQVERLPSTVPEPAIIGLLAPALAGLWVRRRRRP